MKKVQQEEVARRLSILHANIGRCLQQRRHLQRQQQEQQQRARMRHVMPLMGQVRLPLPDTAVRNISTDVKELAEGVRMGASALAPPAQCPCRRRERGL